MRRKLVEAQPHYSDADEILDRIGKLYASEAEAKPVIDEIRTWLRTQRELARISLQVAQRSESSFHLFVKLGSWFHGCCCFKAVSPF